MTEPRPDDPTYTRARKRVEELRGFYMHLLTYLIINLGLFLIDVLTPGGPWFYWPLIGWGVVVLLHGINVLLAGSLFSERWQERKVRQYMERERPRGPPQPPQPQAP